MLHLHKSNTRFWAYSICISFGMQRSLALVCILFMSAGAAAVDVTVDPDTFEVALTLVKPRAAAEIAAQRRSWEMCGIKAPIATTETIIARPQLHIATRLSSYVLRELFFAHERRGAEFGAAVYRPDGSLAAVPVQTPTEWAATVQRVYEDVLACATRMTHERRTYEDAVIFSETRKQEFARRSESLGVTSVFEVAEMYDIWVSLAAVHVFETLRMQPPPTTVPFKLHVGPGGVARV
jgi:hypothetical protein